MAADGQSGDSPSSALGASAWRTSTRRGYGKRRRTLTRDGATIRPPALLAQLVEHLHGKEGVDGSSPSEGSAKASHAGGWQPNPDYDVLLANLAPDSI